MTKHQKFLMASAAASLLLSGCVLKEYNYDEISAQTQIKCKGINQCKGMSACRSRNNACQGLNKCRGRGWIMTSKLECDKAHGMSSEEMVGGKHVK